MESLDWIVSVLVEVEDDGSDEGETVFVGIVGLPRALCDRVPGGTEGAVDDFLEGGLVGDTAGAEFMELLHRGVEEEAPSQVDRLLPGGPAFDDAELVIARALLERT